LKYIYAVQKELPTERYVITVMYYARKNHNAQHTSQQLPIHQLFWMFCGYLTQVYGTIRCPETSASYS